MVTFIIVLLVVGLIAGAVARLLMPGRDSIGIVGTIILGIVGSFVGGFLQNLIQYHTASIHRFHTVGIIGSNTGAWGRVRSSLAGAQAPATECVRAEASSHPGPTDGPGGAART